MDIVFIGDSLTFGYGVIKESSWVNLFIKKHDFSYINRGINGDTTIGILSRFFKDVIENSPKYCFILGGTNDFLSGKSAESVFDNILIMIKDCKENNIEPVILVPPYVAEKEATVGWSSSINYNNINKEILSLKAFLEYSCLEEALLYIDLFAVTKSYYLDHMDIYIDGIHPNATGHNLIYKEINRFFKKNS